jgi:DNA repair protein RadC
LKELYSGHRQRLKERFIKSKHNDLPSYEIIEMLLFLSNPRTDTKPIAKELLSRYKSISSIISTSGDELKLIKGVGDSAVFLFKLIGEVMIRVAYEQVDQGVTIDNWQDLIKYCKILAGNKQQEEFWVIYLDSKNKIIKEDKLQGTLDRVAVYPREIVKNSLLSNAASVIIMHNHPSGQTRPSEADIKVTDEINQSLKLINTELIDHIIVSGVSHFSFKNHMLL